MSALNALLRPVFDLLLIPFSGLPAWVGLVVVSAVTGVAMLVVFKHTSNQEALERVKRQIHASLFEIRLFNDDLPAIFRAQADILKHNTRYLGYSLVPMLWMIVPLVLMIAQLQFHYGYRGLRPGESALLKVTLDASAVPARRPAGAAKPSVTLDLPEGIRAETPGVWIPSKRELAWRLAAEKEGDYEIGVSVGGETFTKSASVSTGITRRSPVRYEPGFLSLLLYPAEAPLPRNGPLESISLSYAEAEVSILGLELHWIIWFFVLSIVFAFALRRPLGVTI